ncbi:septum formation family protein [Leifsonia sp. NPDC058292]|uniref:septum formation family protein n=1 Tax=Leifsonia sp. NPDC058292 TaxID=3346428 RepID=UPI0036D86D35
MRAGSADSADDAGGDGLSRRGWLLLVAATVVVGAALLGVGISATGLSAGGAGGAGAAGSSTSPTVAKHIPEPGSAPVPRGLPPRQTRTPVATVPSQPVGSLAPGACLQTYDSKWADAYPVVDCSQPHIAQLLATGRLPQAADETFPGTDALDKQVSDLCEPSLDWDWVAVWNEDVQLDLRYPNTPEHWATGARTYYCIVYTYSRNELTGSARAAR